MFGKGRGISRLGLLRSALSASSLAVALCATSADRAYALPWDVDMFSQENLKSNEVARAPVKGTVPLGYTPLAMTNDEASEKLQNPVDATMDSVWRGQRLYNANCVPCHGRKGDGKGPVGPLVAAPNLTDDFYKKRTDGRIYAVLQNGGAAMPRYGYKFSTREHWDVVNYVRFLQGLKDVPSVKRPE